jgi:hypothetical protein
LERTGNAAMRARRESQLKKDDNSIERRSSNRIKPEKSIKGKHDATRGAKAVLMEDSEEANHNKRPVFRITRTKKHNNFSAKESGDKGIKNCFIIASSTCARLLPEAGKLQLCNILSCDASG